MSTENEGSEWKDLADAGKGLGKGFAGLVYGLVVSVIIYVTAFMSSSSLFPGDRNWPSTITFLVGIFGWFPALVFGISFGFWRVYRTGKPPKSLD